MLVAVLALLGSVACNLSELAAVTVEPVAVGTETVPVAAATPEVIIVEVTSTPLPEALPPSPVDIEEQLVTSVYSRVGPAVVCITAQDHFGECIGSGFIIDREGHIVTNNHVARAARKLLVNLADERTVPAKIVGADPGSDLAVLDIDVAEEDLTVAELGDSATLRVGQRAIAIGNPFGLERTITIGVISSLARTLPRDDSDFQLAEVIQTDAAINPGNSGGPLLNSQGQVIGVNSAIRTTSGVNMGVGFAIPVDIVKRVAPELIDKGRYRHPWLGVSGRTLSPEVVERAQLPVDNGVLIGEVVPGSPADKAGLRGGNQQIVISGITMLIGGDVVIAIDQVEVKRFDDVVNHLAVHTSVGDVVTLTVLRDNEEIELAVTLEERPGSP